MTHALSAAALALAAIALSGCTLHAPVASPRTNPAPSHSQLPVDIGEVVEVRDKSGRTVVGRLARMDSAAVELVGDRGSLDSVHWQNIATITVIRADHADSILNGMLIGAGIGATYAGIVVAGQAGTSDSPGGGAAAGAVALGGAIGAGVGAVIDLLRRRPERQVVYRSLP